MRTRTAGQYHSLVYVTSVLVCVLFFPTYATADPKLADDGLAEAALQYRQAMEGELYGEAADATKLYIGRLLSSPDYDKRQWGDALARLGEAQRLSGDFDAAIENYSLAIEVLEEQTDRLNDSLIEPLLGIARAQKDAGYLRDAVSNYKRSVHVQQVNTGLHSILLAETLDELSDVFYEIGDYRRANGVRQSHVAVYSQNYPDDYLKQVDARVKQAVMLHATGKTVDANFQYNRIISGIESADSGRSLELLPVIFSYVDFLQKTSSGARKFNDKARRFLRRAIHIAEKNKNATPVDRASAYIALGDYISVQTADRDAAARYYQKAWFELSQSDELILVRDQHLSRPKLLNPVPADTPPAMLKVLRLAEANNDSLSSIRLAVGFDVDSSGRADNIRVLEGDPTGYLDPILVRTVKMFAFRPGFVDAEPVNVSNQMYVIDYPVADMNVDFGQNSFSQGAN